MTSLGILQLMAEGFTVSCIPGVDRLSGLMYTEVFTCRPDIPKGPSQPYEIFFVSKVRETTWSQALSPQLR